MVLQLVANALVALSTTTIHPVWFPYPLVPTLHAARISIAYQANARRSPSPISWATYIVGYLIMCWGGTLLTHHLLVVPPPMLYSFHPYINYIPVHLVLTLFFYLFPAILHPPIIDTLLFPLDALLRTSAVIGTLTLFSLPSTHSIHPSLYRSSLTHLIIGALASSGGGITAATFSTWSPTWSFSTPSLLRSGTGIWGSLDFWGGALVAAVYGVLTRHEAFTDFVGLLEALLFFVVPSEKDDAPLVVQLSPSSAKGLSAIILGLLFGLRAWRVHWATDPPPASKKKSKTQ